MAHAKISLSHSSSSSSQAEMSFADDSLPTAENFAKILARCGLFERQHLRRIMDRLPEATLRNPQKLADHLISADLLTPFQASKLLQGAWHGLVLGPFQILTPLGRGGMGAVYLARNTLAGKPDGLPPLVALKVLPPKRAQREERTLARFLREMDMCRLVSHPHLTKTFEVGEIDGVYYIAMEYIRGASLSQVVKAEGALAPERAAFLFSEVAAGLAHAHQIGLIHRDLKPSNIMVTPNGHAKILDLGLALVIDEELPQDKMIVGGQGYVVGTMDYIAPEQVDNSTEVDSRADLYSLGCSLYFALTGQPPFGGGTSAQKMQRQRTAFAEPIPDINPMVPVEFARVVEKLMEKKPAKRYRMAEQVREALSPWAAEFKKLPLDVDPLLSEAEAIDEINKEQADQPHLWWEELQGVSFEATTKYGKNRRRKRPPSWGSVLTTLAIIVVLLALVFVLETIRR